IEFVNMLVMIPGPIVKLRLKGIEQMAGAEPGGLGHQDTVKVILADPDLGEAFREGFDEVKRRGAGGGKIPDIGIVRPLPKGDIVHELWDDPIQVHIALAVGMGGYVDRDTINKTGEIRAMVQIKTAQEILIGFPAATVLRHSDARDNLQDF